MAASVVCIYIYIYIYIYIQLYKQLVGMVAVNINTQLWTYWLSMYCEHRACRKVDCASSVFEKKR